MGSDTPITIKRPTKWIDPSRIQIYAHLNTGSEDINPTINENHIHFNLEQKVSEQIVSHYSIQYDTSSVFVSDDLIKHGQASLHQNFPNPFNTETTIRYEIPKLEHVELKIYNIYGQEIRSILDEIQPAGKYTIVWSTKNNSGMDVSPGIYFLQMKAGTQLRRRKMLFMK
jgi:hypothetical protein